LFKKRTEDLKAEVEKLKKDISSAVEKSQVDNTNFVQMLKQKDDEIFVFKKRTDEMRNELKKYSLRESKTSQGQTELLMVDLKEKTDALQRAEAKNKDLQLQITNLEEIVDQLRKENMQIVEQNKQTPKIPQQKKAPWSCLGHFK